MAAIPVATVPGSPEAYPGAACEGVTGMTVPSPSPRPPVTSAAPIRCGIRVFFSGTEGK